MTTVEQISAEEKPKLLVFDFADTLAHVWHVRSTAFLSNRIGDGLPVLSIDDLAKVWGQPMLS